MPCKLFTLGVSCRRSETLQVRTQFTGSLAFTVLETLRASGVNPGAHLHRRPGTLVNLHSSGAASL